MTLSQTHAMWVAGIAKIERATDIESLRTGHRELAHSLLDAVNFSSGHREHWTTILSVVKLAIRFDECTKMYRDCMKLEAIGTQPFHIQSKLSDLQRTLPATLDTEIMSQFTRHMKVSFCTLLTFFTLHFYWREAHHNIYDVNIVLSRFALF